MNFININNLSITRTYGNYNGNILIKNAENVFINNLRAHDNIIIGDGAVIY